MVSGIWVVKGTRVPVQAVVDNAEDGYTAEQITGEIFEGLALDRVRSVIRFGRAMNQTDDSRFSSSSPSRKRGSRDRW